MSPAPLPIQSCEGTETMSEIVNQYEALLRLPAVLKRFPVSRSAWYAGVKAGIYPPAIKLGLRTAAWKKSSIDALIESSVSGTTEIKE